MSKFPIFTTDSDEEYLILKTLKNIKICPGSRSHVRSEFCNKRLKRYEWPVIFLDEGYQANANEDEEYGHNSHDLDVEGGVGGAAEDLKKKVVPPFGGGGRAVSVRGKPVTHVKPRRMYRVIQDVSRI